MEDEDERQVQQAYFQSRDIQIASVNIASLSYSFSQLGFVLITKIEYGGNCFVFAPDLQGPVYRKTLSYLLSLNADAMIVGGPPLYLKKFSSEEIQEALYSLITLATSSKHLIVDHHLLRSDELDRRIDQGGCRGAQRIGANQLPGPDHRFVRPMAPDVAFFGAGGTRRH